MFSLSEVPGFYNYTGIVQINRMVVEPYASRNIRTFYLVNLNDQRLIYLINLNDQRITLICMGVCTMYL